MLCSDGAPWNVCRALRSLEHFVLGRGTVNLPYARGYEEVYNTLQDNALRWLRGEYSTRTEAKTNLDVRTIMDDASFYHGLRLLAPVCGIGAIWRVAGLSG